MNRNVSATKQVLDLIYELRQKGVITATNIIIDYTVDNKFYPNYDLEQLNKYFDYFSWNPYFDGNFELEKAKQRFKPVLSLVCLMASLMIFCVASGAFSR